MQEPCIFCQILQGEIPAYRVYEDDATLAFMDIFPVSRGHVLVITKEHYRDLFDASAWSLAAVTATVSKVAGALRKVCSPAGLTVAQLNGKAAGQTVFHYHTHLIPRNEGDSMELHARTQGDPRDLAVIAEALRKALAGATTME